MSKFAFLLLVALTIALLVPGLGFIVAIFGGALLYGTVFLAFVLAFAFDAATERIPRYLLALPLGFFGIYYAVYFWEDFQIRAVESQLRDTNPGVVLQFDPAQYDLFSKNAEILVTTFDIPIAYEHNLSGGVNAIALLRREVCNEINERFQYLHRGLIVNVKDGPAKGRYPNLCLYRFLDIPQKRSIEITSANAEKSEQLTEFPEVITRVKRDGMEVGQFRVAVAQRLLPFPYAMLGCAYLTSNGGCAFGFARDYYTLNTVPGAPPAGPQRNPVAVLLGLTPRTGAQLRDFDGGMSAQEINDRFVAATREAGNGFLDALDALERDPGTEIARDFAFNIGAHPVFLEQYGDRIIDVFLSLAERETEIARKNASVLSGIIADLPREIFLPRAPEFFALLEASDWRKDRSKLYMRTADLGPETLPKYLADLRQTDAKEMRRVSSALAICRIGKVSDPVRRELEAMLIDTPVDRRDDLHLALYLILVQNSDPGFLDEVIESLPEYQQKQYRRWMNEAKPGALPRNCATSNSYPIRAAR